MFLLRTLSIFPKYQMWAQACCLEKEVHGSKHFMHSFWSWDENTGHDNTQGTSGRSPDTAQKWHIGYSAWNSKPHLKMNDNNNATSFETLGVYLLKSLSNLQT